MTAPSIRGVVRGEAPVGELAAMGVRIREEGGLTKIEVPAGLAPDEAISTADVAKGFLRHRGDPGKLREWASCMVAIAGEAFDLEERERAETWDALMSAVQDAAFGREIADDTARWIEGIAK